MPAPAPAPPKPTANANANANANSVQRSLRESTLVSRKRSQDAMPSKSTTSPSHAPAKKGKRRKTDSQSSRSDPVQGSSQPAVLDGNKTSAVIERDEWHASEGENAPLWPEVAASSRSPPESITHPVFELPPSPPPRPLASTTDSKLRTKVKLLEAEMERLKAQSEQEVRKARLDDIFHRTEAKRKHNVLAEKLKQQCARIDGEAKKHLTMHHEMSKRLADKDAVIEDLKSQLETDKAKISAATSDRAFWRDQAEHTEQLLRTAEDDFEELSKLETEERCRRQREDERREELPPAYGSLDDETRVNTIANPTEAIDSGALELASIKRTIRSAFHGTLYDIQQRHACYRRYQGICAPRVDGILILRLSNAVEDAARNIQGALRHAGEITTLTLRKDKVLTSGACKPKDIVAVLSRHVAETEYVAERLAKLVLDLVARALTLLDMRPDLTPRLIDSDYTRTRLSWSTVDIALLETLRILFKHAPPSAARQEKLFLLQYFLTQVNMLKQKFNGTSATMVYGDTRHGTVSRLAGARLFEQSLLWLEEQVESERMIAANDTRPESERNSMLSQLLAEPLVNSRGMRPEVIVDMVHRRLDDLNLSWTGLSNFAGSLAGLPQDARVLELRRRIRRVWETLLSTSPPPRGGTVVDLGHIALPAEPEGTLGQRDFPSVEEIIAWCALGDEDSPQAGAAQAGEQRDSGGSRMRMPALLNESASEISSMPSASDSESDSNDDDKAIDDHEQERCHPSSEVSDR